MGRIILCFLMMTATLSSHAANPTHFDEMMDEAFAFDDDFLIEFLMDKKNSFVLTTVGAVAAYKITNHLLLLISKGRVKIPITVFITIATLGGAKPAGAYTYAIPDKFSNAIGDDVFDRLAELKEMNLSRDEFGAAFYEMFSEEERELLRQIYREAKRQELKEFYQRCSQLDYCEHT